MELEVIETIVLVVHVLAALAIIGLVLVSDGTRTHALLPPERQTLYQLSYTHHVNRLRVLSL